MEYTLPATEVIAAIRRSKNGPYQGADREFYIMKAFRAAFGKDFVEWSRTTMHEVIANDDGSLTLREPEKLLAKKPRKARKDKGVKRAKRTVQAVPAEPLPVAA